MNTEMQLLADERKKTTFCVEELTNIVDGGKNETQRRRKIEKTVRDDPVLKPCDINQMTREERYVSAMRKTVHVFEKILPQGDFVPRGNDMIYLHRAMGDFTLGIHSGAFLPSLMSFSSEEQLAKWVPLALKLNIIGTYAQTELAHGTFLRGLQTEATYDLETEEFVMNCPSIKAMKWWPGDLGKSANHALVMANLKIKGVSYGMHPFIVQIRDLTTHQPLPGVSVGEIGPKLAFEVYDNGFLYLQNVRIPRENLLCKNAEVLRDGTYKKKASDRLMYGSMVNLRVTLQRTEAVLPLSRALTIAVRYSAVRCQGLIDPEKPEVAVLEYKTQQYKLLPQLAAAYSALFAVNAMEKKYRSFVEKMRTGDISELPELHALSAGMKSFITEQCIHSAEVARRACGGHGYSNLSGFPRIITSMMGSCTYEGENTVLYLQCARFLVKCLEQRSGTNGFLAYLADPDYICSVKSPDFFSPEVLVKCFQQRSKQVVKEAAGILTTYMQSGQPRHQAWNNAGVYLMRAAKVHILQNVVTESQEVVRRVACTINLKTVLTHLISLYALHQLNNDAADFLRFGILTPAQCEMAQKAEMNLLDKLRPNAVGLVDAFDHSDDTLQSCLGVYDGNVYESLYESAKKAPFNKSPVHEATYKYLRPHLHEGRDILEGGKSKL